ncbi:hypothetical protein F5Y19DRAFT_473110 [Xylariaceae sp. FL1651]|nr:hypothetical protein F5Y19DRAFT_473110 [Xylariaceae sp. FL1651]
MDALKSFTGGNKAENTGSSTSAVPAGQKDDYGDKGASFLNKKYLNDKLSRDQLEKITDAGREGIEKMTG